METARIPIRMAPVPAPYRTTRATMTFEGARRKMAEVLVQRDSDFRWNSAQRGDALVLLHSLPDYCTPLVFFDPQHRDALDKLAYGNEGARQKGRALLPAMTSDYVDDCCREVARVLRPSGYLLQWVDTFRLCEAYHKRIVDALKCVDLIAWDNQRIGNGYRSWRRRDYLLVLQKPPIAAKSTWRDHSIPNRSAEKSTVHFTPTSSRSVSSESSSVPSLGLVILS
jgi:site-specific DNA-methyltransferase (adenine-specific)